ncbi:MAG: hypothetical protein ACXABG_14250 [Promethearchaeota archaeon]|jgi:hypothetical protein
MPYLISFAKWPSDKTAEVMKKAIEAIKKFPEDESLGEGLVSGNAIKASEDGVKSISVLSVSKGKLEEAYSRGQAVGNFYALSIEGFEYDMEVWANIEEAYGSIGQKPPE